MFILTQKHVPSSKRWEYDLRTRQVSCFTDIWHSPEQPPFERLVRMLHFSRKRTLRSKGFAQSLLQRARTGIWASRWPAACSMIRPHYSLWRNIFKPPTLEVLAKGTIHRYHTAEETTISLGFVAFAAINDLGYSSRSWHPKPISSWYMGNVPETSEVSMEKSEKTTFEFLKHMEMAISNSNPQFRKKGTQPQNGRGKFPLLGGWITRPA